MREVWGKALGGACEHKEETSSKHYGDHDSKVRPLLLVAVTSDRAKCGKMLVTFWLFSSCWIIETKNRELKKKDNDLKIVQTSVSVFVPRPTPDSSLSNFVFNSSFCNIDVG